MNLALMDINTTALQKAGQILSSSSSGKDLKTETYHLDVSQQSEWAKVRTEVEKTFDSVDILMLNAGASFKPQEAGKAYEDLDYWQKTISTNLFGYVNGLATFLPLVQKNKGESAVIITGSKQGITNPPGNPAYNASKAAVKSLTEHLSYDMKKSNPNVKVHLLIPGWTFTGLSGNVGPTTVEEAMKKKPEKAWLPMQVAEFLEKKIGDGKFYVLCPDGDVSEELDGARMTWQMGDAVEGRPALSRWDDAWKDRASEWIQKEKGRREKM